MRKMMLILITAAMCAVMAGCANPPPMNFSVPDVGVSKAKIDAEVKTITVTLARPDEAKGDVPMWLEREHVTDSWKEALQEAMDRMAIFKDDSSNKISIQVKILAVDIPVLAASVTTKSVARYEIIDRSKGAIIYTQDVSAEGFVPFDYALLAFTRGRESVNRSAQNNIKLFLQALETVDIKKPMFPSAVQK